MADKHEKLQKAPPPLPLQRPPAAARSAPPLAHDLAHVSAGPGLASPWDAESSAAPLPPARAAAGLQQHQWLGKYPLVKPQHAEELEQHAAVNEFGQKMPRAAAEAMAYGHYAKKQRVQAAAHHLAGMKAAQAAGDMESARKHGAMYALHSKALGHDVAGPAHPAVQAELANAPGKYKFRAHAADALALAPHVTEHGAVSSAPAPPKTPASFGVPAPQPAVHKALHDLWVGLQKLQGVEPMAKAEPVVKAEAKGHCPCDAYSFPHRHGGGRCRRRK